MIPVTEYREKTVAVFGLARSGLSSARALKAGGADVVAWDDSADRREAAIQAGIAVKPMSEVEWRATAALILSPGIPLSHPKPHPVVSMARAANCPVIGDIELFARALKAGNCGRIVAITGTNGKSTTTALIGHVLTGCGRKAAAGGNIGTPALELEPLGADGVYSLEVSSYQIDLAPSLDADVAVLLNISPDHLDRHGGMDGYVAVKRRLIAQQSAGKAAVIGIDDAYARDIYDGFKDDPARRVTPVAVGRAVEKGVYVVDGVLYDAMVGKASRVADLTRFTRLPGAHNWQNAAAAFAAARALGLDSEKIVAAIATFPGLAHRMESVASIRGVRFVNDSKATNADAAEKALVCYDAVYWIAGGKAKEGGIETLAPHFPRIRRAYLIGEAAADFASTLEGKVKYSIERELERAVAAAYRDAAADGLASPVVLLSPACASFDQFRDFEYRGEAFRRAVAALDPEARA